MYEVFYRLKEKPFSLLPDPSYLYLSEKHQMALTLLDHTFVNFLIEQYAKNRNTVLIVDEAQNMSVETLEELRMLSNINADKDQVLQIILVGKPGLRDKLSRSDLEQFAQRIAVG